MAFTCGKSSGSGGRNSVQCWLHNGLLGALGTAWSFLGPFFCLYNGMSSQVLSTPPYSSNRYNPQSFLRDSKASFSGERPIFRTIKMSSHYLRKWVTTRDRIELSLSSLPHQDSGVRWAAEHSLHTYTWILPERSDS